MRKTRLVIAIVLGAVLVTVLAAATAHASPRVLIKPSASYAMTNPCGTGSYCTITVTIGSNPSNYNVRAWMQCSDQRYHYGGWHQSGTSTAGCGTNGGHGLIAGFQYDKTHQYVADCWIISGPRTGSC